jgi:hypothetical protein
MANVRIERLTDVSSPCETCGTSWAEGYIVFVDGQEVICKEPIASCYGGQHFSEEDLLKDILGHFGHELEVDAPQD